MNRRSVGWTVISLMAAMLLFVACGQERVTPAPIATMVAAGADAAAATATRKPGLATPTPLPTTTPIVPTSTSTHTPTPLASATPVAGLKVPVAGDHWQVTLEDVRQETTLRSMIGANNNTYSAKEGYAFLVVDATFHNLDPADQSQLSTKEVTLVNEAGEILEAVGGGDGTDYCVGCVRTWSPMKEFVEGVVFVLPEEALDQVFEFHFGQVPAIPFSVREEMGYSLTTEIRGELENLPPTCSADGLAALSTTGRLAFQRWEQPGLVLASVNPDGNGTTQLCTDIAYGDVQFAPDGAALLLLGPAQGWPSLYMIEPGGESYVLVKNGQDIKAAFDPSGRWVLFAVRTLGEAGQGLYSFDRETHSTSLVKEGSQEASSCLADARLLVQHTAAGESSPEFYMGPPDGGALERLEIPADILDSYKLAVSTDGQHLVYVQQDEAWDQHLFLADLDGSHRQELASTSYWGLQGLLSPDGQLMLIGSSEGFSASKAELRNLVTGDSWVVVTGSNGVNFDFSPDGRWAFALSTVRPSGTEGQAQHALYLVDTANGSIREIPEAINAYFATDSSQLAYTVRNPDSSLDMYVTSLATGAVQSLGAGYLTGWFSE